MFKSTAQNGMVWFEGVVEDRSDPLKLGRVRVRCIGLHTSDARVLPSEELQWAQVMHPTTSAAISGVGHTPGLIPGTHVIGFFRDGISCQDPIIMGSVGGIPQQEPQPGNGFNDPNGEFPRSDYVGEPDTNRLARNEGETIADSKKETRITDVLSAQYMSSGIGDSAVSSTSFSEPEIPYATVYPYNKVIETESGHIIELDDTEDAERINIHHKSGTFDEYHPNGSKVFKTIQNNFKFVNENDYEHVKGEKIVTVAKGQKLLVNAEGSGDGYVLEVGEGGDLSIYVSSGDVNLNVAGGNLNKYVDGNINEVISGNVEREIGGNLTETVSGTVTKDVGGSKTENVSGSKTTEVGGTFIQSAAQIFLN